MTMIEVPVSKLRSELKRWLEAAYEGEEIVVTDHGKPVARIVGAGQLTALERLVRAGVARRPRRPKSSVSSRARIVPKKPVSPLVSDLRD